MKCATYNIQYGLGADGVYDLSRIAGEIEGGDIVALQEVDRFWRRSGMVDSPAVIGDALPSHHWVYGANLDMSADFEEGGRIVRRRKQFGTMILSRWPILSSRNFPLPKWGDRRNHSIQQGLLEAVIKTPIGPMRVYSAHLSHLCSETRLPQIEAIMDILSRAPAEGGAWCGGHPDPESGWIEEDEPPMPESLILMGDMNFAPESEEYKRIVGPHSARYGRLTNRSGLIDAWTEAGHPENEGSTHPQAAARIDHCFVSSDLAPRIRSAQVDTAATGSDHWPVWVEIS